MKPSVISRTLRNLASRLRTSRPSRGSVAADLRRVLSAMETTDRSWAGPWASVKFTGSISSQFDGENTEGEGTLSFPDGRTAELSFSGSASARGAEYVLDGEPVDPGSETQTHLDTLFENIWPDFESDFEGLKIVDNEVYG